MVLAGVVLVVVVAGIKATLSSFRPLPFPGCDVRESERLSEKRKVLLPLRSLRSQKRPNFLAYYEHRESERGKAEDRGG